MYVVGLVVWDVELRMIFIPEWIIFAELHLKPEVWYSPFIIKPAKPDLHCFCGSEEDRDIFVCVIMVQKDYSGQTGDHQEYGSPADEQE